MNTEISDLKEWISTRDLGVRRNTKKFVLALCECHLETEPGERHLARFDRKTIYAKMGIKDSNSQDALDRRLRAISSQAIAFVTDGKHRLMQFASCKGHSAIASIESDGSGGRGNEALFWIEIRSSGINDHVVEQGTEIVGKAVDHRPESPRTNELVIIPKPKESTKLGQRLIHVLQENKVPTIRHGIDPRIIYTIMPRSGIMLTQRGRLMYGTADGPLTKVRQNLILGRMVVAMASIILANLMSALYMILSHGPLMASQIGTMAVTILFGITYYTIGIRPFIPLRRMRMMLIQDEMLQDGQYPAVLEKIDDPESDKNALLLVTRYESSCKVCGSKIILRNGGKNWPERLVGTCMSSPTEHVYTFDRFSLVGNPLRPGMVGLFEF